jgi:hypothetical protein
MRVGERYIHNDTKWSFEIIEIGPSQCVVEMGGKHYTWATSLTRLRTTAFFHLDEVYEVEMLLKEYK